MVTRLYSVRGAQGRYLRWEPHWSAYVIGDGNWPRFLMWSVPGEEHYRPALWDTPEEAARDARKFLRYDSAAYVTTLLLPVP